MSTPDFFRSRLDKLIDLKHPLAVLATRMPWSPGAMVSKAALFGQPVQLVSTISAAGWHEVLCAAGFNFRWLMWAIARLDLAGHSFAPVPASRMGRRSVLASAHRRFP